ncbi:MAG: ferrous iron transport protein A [Pirellulaceae bacterium]|nr:ferrous iron transport protein A [Pirellulaceae bacterium]
MRNLSEERLSTAELGDFVCIDVDSNNPSHTRMKSLGICPGRELELVANGDPMIVRVFGSQIGLSRRLAEAVSVSKSSVARKAK